MRIPLAVVLAAYMASGCTTMNAGPPGPASAPTPSPATGAAPAPRAAPGPLGPLGGMVAAIRADAAGRTGMAESAVHVKAVDTVVWRDGSIGCPRPGLAYTQALVPGWRLQVTAGERAFVYHASRRGQWVWCPPEQAQPPLPRDAAQ